MSGRGWYVLDGRRVVAGPFAEQVPFGMAKTWLHDELRDRAGHTVITDEEVRRRLAGVRVLFGVRASRGGFKCLPLPGTARRATA